LTEVVVVRRFRDLAVDVVEEARQGAAEDEQGSDDEDDDARYADAKVIDEKAEQSGVVNNR
jgi:hypothetical protein